MNRGAAFLLIAAAALPQTAPRKPEPPVQPLPFSHKKHNALGLDCRSCHEMAEPGESMGIPAAARCMSCHATTGKDSPEIQKLAAFARENRSVPWKRVYRIPDYVFFSHKAHLEKLKDRGIYTKNIGPDACLPCHGPVEQRDALARETDLSMAGCMDCHRKQRASLECNFCHETR